jgi:SEC-C motif-containing protein
MIVATSACPCVSGKTYAQCCKPLHDGAIATTAEALMRSRYGAYVAQLEPYLLETWHATTRPAALDPDEGEKLTWLGLSVKRHAIIGDNSATVEFVARYRISGGSAVRLHEISRFVREDGRWFYLDGDFPDTGQAKA